MTLMFNDYHDDDNDIQCRCKENTYMLSISSSLVMSSMNTLSYNTLGLFLGGELKSSI